MIPQKLFEEHPDLLQPVARRNEMLSRLKEGLQVSAWPQTVESRSHLCRQDPAARPLHPGPPSALTPLLRAPQDVPISRTNFSWGVPMPGDEKHVIYVWRALPPITPPIQRARCGSRVPRVANALELRPPSRSARRQDRRSL